MNDRSTTTRQTLSEISHLFLSSVRDRATGGQGRPVRVPPASGGDIDLSSQELAEVFVAGTHQDDAASVAPATVVLSAHLGDRQRTWVHAYARWLAGQGQRIGLIELDSASCRISCLEPSLDAPEPVADPVEQFTVQQINDAMVELNADVDQWILWLPNPRLIEAQSLLKQARHLTLLSTAGHDGIVDAYRTIKGLADGHQALLSLAVCGATSQQEAGRVAAKLSSACRQFLNWPICEQVTLENQTRNSTSIIQHTVASWQAVPARQIVALRTLIADFISQAAAPGIARDEMQLDDAPIAMDTAHAAPDSSAQQVDQSPRLRPVSPLDETIPMMTTSRLADDHNTARIASSCSTANRATTGAVAASPPEVIELTSGETSTRAILSAVTAHPGRGVVECPINPPAFDSGRLVVDRQHRLILLAAIGQGLSELSAVGAAYNWLIENRGLVAMALPQLGIDAHALPVLSLLIDQADVRAEQLAPLLAGKNVRIETYRKLRWGSKTGVLLEAA